MDLLKGFHGEFAWFIYGLVLLGVIWFFTGGTRNQSAHEGAYIKPPAPLDSGRAYGTYYDGNGQGQSGTLNLSRAPGDFLLKFESFIGSMFSQTGQPEKIGAIPLPPTKNIFFGDITQAKAGDSDKEFISIEADPSSRNQNVISGLILRGSGLNTSIIVPQAVNMLVLRTTFTRADVSLPPSGHAIITSGRSPVGTSFRVNKCTGYLDQFQNYFPSLDKNCPYPSDELKSYGPNGEAVCAEFVAKIPRCQIYQGAPPKTLSNTCVNFLAEKLNYNACVADHKNDSDFYSNEWRLFENQPNELWKNNNEIIRLMDNRGTVLDTVNY